MSGIKDFFLGAVDTLDAIAGSDTAKLYTAYEGSRRADKIKLEEMKSQRYIQAPIADAHTQIVREGSSVSESASSNTFNFSDATKYLPYGLALLIPLFFFLKR